MILGGGPRRLGWAPARVACSARGSRLMTRAMTAMPAIRAANTNSSCAVPMARTITPVPSPTSTVPSGRAEPMVPNSRLALRASWRSLAIVQNWTMNRLETTSAQT